MTELDPFLNAISHAARSPFAQLAVVSALTLPDICVSLADPDDSRHARGKRYKAWCSENLSVSFPFLAPDDIWSLRNGLAHSGRIGDATQNFERYLLLMPSSNKMSSMVLNDAYAESVDVFCDKFCEAAKNWVEERKETEPVRTNLQRLVTVHKHGFLPYVMGPAILG